MPFSILGLVLALITAGIIYFFQILKMKKKGIPIKLTVHNLMIATIVVGAGYYLYTGVLALLKIP
jgi:hypothetical protein